MGAITCYGCTHLTSPRHAENQGTDGLGEIKQKFKRLLMYVSRKSTSGGFYSLFLSQHLPKFYGFKSLFPSIHFPQHESSSFQQLRDTVFILASHTPKRKPSMLWRAAVNHFKWLFQWEMMMENATLILSPHPCNRWTLHWWHLSITALGCSVQSAQIYLQTWKHLGGIL